METKSLEKKNPVVLVSLDCMNFQKKSVLNIDHEFFWRGYVLKKDNLYYVYRIFYPKQKVMNGVFCKCYGENDEIRRLITLNQQSEIGNMKYYAHSHVKMGVAASSHDFEQNIKTMNETKSFIVTGIFNKKGNFQFDIYDYERQMYYCDVESHAYVENMKETLITIANTFKDNQACIIDSDIFNDKTICNSSYWDYMVNQFQSNVLDVYNMLLLKEKTNDHELSADDLFDYEKRRSGLRLCPSDKQDGLSLEK